MDIDRSSLRRPAVITAAAALAALGIAGCNQSSDPNAAPYGASASPSVATISGPAEASAAPPSSPPKPSASAEPAVDPIGPDTKVPAKAPRSAPKGDPGSDVTAPTISGPDTGSPMAGAGGPMMGGMGSSPTAPLTPTPEMDAKITAAEKSGNKTEIGTAYALRGTFRMNDASAGARVKYRAALEDYRKALAADPKNEEAKHNKDLIEGIYKQMGRPIP